MVSGVLPRKALLEIQEGGAGASNWKVVGIHDDITKTRLGALDGGDIEFTDHFGRNWKDNGELQIVDTFKTGTPQPFTVDFEVEYNRLATLLQIEGRKNLRVRRFAGDYTIKTDYRRMRVFCNSLNTKLLGSDSRDNSNDFEDIGDQWRVTYPQRITSVLDIDPIVPSNISGTVTTLGIAHGISVGFKRQSGDVSGENQNNPGDKEYLFVTLKDGSNLPHVFWSSTKGASWVDNTGTGLTNFDGTHITKAGPYVVISGSGAGGGLAYALFEDVKAGTATWTRSTNISAGTVINAVVAITSTQVIAVGNTGAVYISENSGRSFASAGAAVTANNLTRIASAGEDLQWFGGASGTLIRRYRGVMSVVAVSGLAAAINSLAVPPNWRKEEVFVGAANGNIYKSVNGIATTPTFSLPEFDGKGVGAVDWMGFAGWGGQYLYVAQTNGSTQSRILRDHSGGALDYDTEIVGTFTSPANASINALAIGGLNTVMAFGDVSGGQGFIELAA